MPAYNMMCGNKVSRDRYINPEGYPLASNNCGPRIMCQLVTRLSKERVVHLFK